MSENYSEDKREKNKPDEEVGTSQGPHQTDPSEDKKALDRFSEAQLRGNFAKNKTPDYWMQPCVKSVSSSAEIPKLTVVFDLDWTLIYSSKEKLLPAQQRLASGKAYTAIRPYCDTLLKNIRQFCTIMVFSFGSESYVNEIRNLIDPNGEYFDEVFSRNSCTKYCNLYGKDLAKTGADLKRTVLIDDRTQSFLFQPHNGILIRPWTGQEDDTELVKMEKLIMELTEEDLDQHAFSATVNREPTVEEPNMDNIQEKLLNEFFDLFDENIGTVKNTRATLHVKPRAEPKTFNAKRIAFQLKKPVEAEVQRLVKEGMSESVDPAATPLKWATPVVCIDKRNGNVRICGNFRATINPNLLPESHLLPIFEELTTKLVSGQEFSTIDLKDAFLQMLKYNLCIASPLNTIYFSFHWGSERGVSVSLAWGCAELLYRGSSPDMKKENCGVKRSAMSVCRAKQQEL
ncbi:CTD small phosphatase-like protein 2 [Trichinella spiralis]|uniref:Mitochondrial import inner membrane translocase subunit TIM50 n=2 Tax=Trichinella spiralis TaxID=6334 RepID=A0A0V1AX99_TRISP|nr:CTD small phosphatase-like protein 2 [Trichinella spiralis]